MRRRFDRSLRNFWTLYRPLAESWTVYDNSGLTFEEVVFEERGGRERSPIRNDIMSFWPRSQAYDKTEHQPD